MEDTENKTNETEEKENTAARIWDQAKSHAREALDWGRKLSHVGKLKLDLARIQRDRQSLYQELGRKTHELLKEDSFDLSLLGDLCTKIDEVTGRINLQQMQVEEALKSQPDPTEPVVVEPTEEGDIK